MGDIRTVRLSPSITAQGVFIRVLPYGGNCKWGRGIKAPEGDRPEEAKGWLRHLEPTPHVMNRIFWDEEMRRHNDCVICTAMPETTRKDKKDACSLHTPKP